MGLDEYFEDAQMGIPKLPLKNRDGGNSASILRAQLIENYLRGEENCLDGTGQLESGKFATGPGVPQAQGEELKAQGYQKVPTANTSGADPFAGKGPM